MDERDLYHWGIKGMKWGVRRFQNKDGSLTAAGKRRYVDNDGLFRSDKEYAEKHEKRLMAKFNESENKEELKDLHEHYLNALKTIEGHYGGASGYDDYVEGLVDRNTLLMGTIDILERRAFERGLRNCYDDPDVVKINRYYDLAISMIEETDASLLFAVDERYDSAIELGRVWFENQELYHHGIKGQKHGVRRYQNEDGSLTALGRIHYGVGKAGKAIGSGAAKAGKTIGKMAKAGVEKHKAKIAAKKESKRIEELMKKPLHKLTNEELAERTKRAEAEKRLSETEDKYTNKVKGVMAKFGKDFWDKAVVPAATEAGKDIIKNVLKKTADKILDVDAKELFKLAEEGGDLSKYTNEQIADASKRATNINTIRQQLAQASRAGTDNQQNNQQKPKDNKPKDNKPDNQQKQTSSGRKFILAALSSKKYTKAKPSEIDKNTTESGRKTVATMLASSPVRATSNSTNTLKKKRRRNRNRNGSPQSVESYTSELLDKNGQVIKRINT